MIAELLARQRADDTYTEMYKQIKSDIKTDTDLVDKYLKDKSHEVDWIHRDIIQLVDSMQLESKKAHMWDACQENPKWQKLAKALERAQIKGRASGLFKSSKNQDFTPIWKRTVTIGDYQIKIEPEHAKLLGNRPEASVEKSKSPL